MTVKQLFAVVLTVVLLLTAGFPSFALAKDTADSTPIVTVPPPPESTQLQPENSSPPTVSAEPQPGESVPPAASTQPQPEESVPPAEISEPPVGSIQPPGQNASQPAEFYMELMTGGNGSKIVGVLPEYTPDMREIRSYYSFDGVNYQPTQDDN